MPTNARQRPLAILLTARRQELGITLGEMVTRLKAKRMALTDSSLSRWEAGESTPLEVYLPAIAAAYRIPRGAVIAAWKAQRAEKGTP